MHDPSVVYAVQAVHGVVVAGVVIGSALYVEACAPPQLLATAQSLYSMIAVGLGSIVSNAASGWLLEHAGPDVPFLAGGAGALGLVALIPWLLPRPRDGPLTDGAAAAML